MVGVVDNVVLPSNGKEGVHHDHVMHQEQVLPS